MDLKKKQKQKIRYLYTQILIPAAISSLKIGSMDFGESDHLPLMTELQNGKDGSELTFMESIVRICNIIEKQEKKKKYTFTIY